MKSSEVSIKTRSTPASLTIQGQVTKDTTVKWPVASATRKVIRENCYSDKGKIHRKSFFHTKSFYPQLQDSKKLHINN